MLPGYLKKEKDTLYFNQDGELIYCIPEKYFDTKNAIIVGEYVDTMGIFDYEIFDKSGKSSGIKNFYCPTTIRCKPSKIEKVAEFKLKGIDTPLPYRLLHFTKGDEVISSTIIPKNLNNVEKFMHLLIGGNLPVTIPYNILHEYVIGNASANGFGYNMSAQMIGIIISELCRDKNDLSKAFRNTDMKNMNDYKMINISSLPKYLSPYIAITSQNADECIASAITNKNHKDTPLEKVMMN